jgi:hypothetical protein
VTQGIESLLIWLACVLVFGGSGVVCTFFPQIVQRAALNAPTPRWKFIPKPQDMWAVRATGGFASKKYMIQIRVIGVLNLIATALLILLPLGAFR